MWLYFSVIVVSYLFVVLSFRTNNKIFSLLLSCIAVLIPSLLAGYRDDTVGMDLMYYAVPCFNSVQGIQNISQLSAYISFSGLEPLYVLYNFIITRFTDDIFWAFFIQQVIVLSMVLFTCYRLRKNLNAPALYLLFMLLCYCLSMSHNRQIFAYGILFYSYYYVLNHKFIKFMICIVVATLFHSSGIIVLPIYFLYVYIIELKGNIKISTLLIVCFAGIAFFYAFPFIITALSNWGFFPSKYLRYADSTNSAHKIDLLLLFLLWFITFIGNRSPQIINIIRIFLILTFFFYLCGVYNDVAARIARYYLLFTMLIITAFAKQSPKTKNFISAYVIFLFLVLYFYQTITTDMAGALPYTSQKLGIIAQ